MNFSRLSTPVLAVIFALAFSNFVHAKDLPIMAGMWEVTTKLDPKVAEAAMKDVPPEAQEMFKESGFGTGEMKAEDCVTEKDLKEGFLPEEEGCVSKELSKTKTKWIFEMTCKDPVSTSKIEFEFGSDKKTYKNKITSEIVEDGEKIQMEVHQEGRWLRAACDKA